MPGAQMRTGVRGIAIAIVVLIAGLAGPAVTARGQARAWDAVQPGAARGTVTEAVVEGPAGRTRKVWVYTPAAYDSKPEVRARLLVLFDGADYIADIPAPMILDNLHAASAIPLTVAVMVDTADGRIADLANHQAFADYVATTIVPWARSHYRVEADPSAAIVGGYSAGGLAAAYVAYRHPEVFGRVLSQSGAFWRGNEGASSPTEWLTDQFRTSPKLPLTFFIDVGAGETGTTAGGPVFIETNRRLRDVLRQKGYALRYIEVPGAVHNPDHWRTQLGDGLIYLSSR